MRCSDAGYNVSGCPSVEIIISTYSSAGEGIICRHTARSAVVAARKRKSSKNGWCGLNAIRPLKRIRSVSTSSLWNTWPLSILSFSMPERPKKKSLSQWRQRLPPEVTVLRPASSWRSTMSRTAASSAVLSGAVSVCACSLSASTGAGGRKMPITSISIMVQVDEVLNELRQS